MVKKINITYRNIYYGRFLIQIVVLHILLFFGSCNKEELEKNVIEQSLNLQIDNKQFRLVNDNFLAEETCNDFLINISYENLENNLKIGFVLSKNGDLKAISLIDWKNSNFYHSPDFNPLGLLSIKNFKYDKVNRHLHFDFDGELIKTIDVNDNLDTSKERLNIKGTFTTNNLKSKECILYNPELTFEVPELKFVTTTMGGAFNPARYPNPYVFRFYSNNGYRILIQTKSDLWNLEKGTYNFDQSSLENRIDIEQYIGIIRATELLWIREIDWKKYQASGNYTILEHQITNGKKVTKGEFNLQVFDNGILKYNITNANFEVIGF
jgi:hypothetical protein